MAPSSRPARLAERELAAAAGVLAVGEHQQHARALAARLEGGECRAHAFGERRAPWLDQLAVEPGQQLAQRLVVGRERSQQHTAAREGCDRRPVAGSQPREQIVRRAQGARESTRRCVARVHAARDVDQQGDVDARGRNPPLAFSEARPEQSRQQQGQGEQQRCVAGGGG